MRAPRIEMHGFGPSDGDEASPCLVVISHDGTLCVDFDRALDSLHPTISEARELAAALVAFADEVERRGLS